MSKNTARVDIADYYAFHTMELGAAAKAAETKAKQRLRVANNSNVEATADNLLLLRSAAYSSLKSLLEAPSSGQLEPSTSEIKPVYISGDKTLVRKRRINLAEVGLFEVGFTSGHKESMRNLDVVYPVGEIEKQDEVLAIDITATMRPRLPKSAARWQIENLLIGMDTLQVVCAEAGVEFTPIQFEPVTR